MRSVYRDWVGAVARWGLVCHGLIYAMLGVMGLHVFLGGGGETTDFLGILGQLIDSPLGRAYVLVMALGFLGFAVWRFVHVFWDTEMQGAGFIGIAMRGIFLLIGAGYVVLALALLRMVFTGVATDGDMQAESTVGRLLNTAVGWWSLFTVGIVIAVSAWYQFYHAVTARFRPTLKRYPLNRQGWLLLILAGRVGLLARGVLFSLLALLLYWSLFTFDPQRAGSQGDAFDILASLPGGRWLAVGMAGGLMVYAGFVIIQARLRFIFMDEKAAKLEEHPGA